MSPKLKEYAFGEIIHTGTLVKLRKCTHVASGQIVVIKMIDLKGFRDKENWINLAKREMFLAKNLKHPNIVNCYEAKVFKHTAFIVMEWMEGGSLKDYLTDRQPLTEEEARKYFRQLIYGIEFCHKHLSVHRDIKPANLLLNKTKEHLKIADFGHGNFLAQDKLNTHCGTELYMSPEMLRAKHSKESYSGPEVDIYSCGVTLFHLLKGTLLRSDIDLLSGKVKFPESPANPDNFSTNVKDLISRMTLEDPQSRITLAEIKRHVWFQGGDQMILDDPHGAGNGIDNGVLLNTISKTNCGRKRLIKYLIRGKHTEVTTTYKLLKKAMEDEPAPSC